MRKLLATLNIGDYEPEITRLTYPLMEAWAKKIGAEFEILSERLLTKEGDGKPINYEKFQLASIAPHYDWTIFLDADALVSPDTPDWTEMIGKETVLFNGLDNRLNRFRASHNSRRSGSKAGACTWNVTCSDWTADLWAPPADFAAAVENIVPIFAELRTGHCLREHLIDDYQLSENIARFGLKTETIGNICQQIGHANGYYCHAYNCAPYEKIKIIRAKLDELGMRY